MTTGNSPIDADVFSLPLALLALLAFSGALWVAAALVCPPHRSRGNDTIRSVLRTIAAILAGIVALILLFLFTSAAGVPLLIIAGWIALFTFLRFLQTEKRMLVEMLALAAERQIPLPVALRAFAADRSDRLGATARRAAEGLEFGLTLEESLRRAGALLPPDVLLAIRVGAHHNRLETTLAQARERYGRIAQAWQPLVLKGTYLFAVALVMVSVLTFMMVKIMPTFQMMFAEFDQSLPTVTQFTIACSTVVGKWLPVWGTCLSLAAGAAFFLVLLPLELNASGYLSWEPLLGRRFLRRIDTAVILRVLSQAVARGLPLPEAIAQLAQWYPRRSVQKLLTKADTSISRGAPWREALSRWKLVNPADAALLGAAERSGNLAWAMREIADGAERRFVYRSQSILSVMFPLLVLGLGVIVMFIAVSVMMPLSGLISNLSL